MHKSKLFLLIKTLNKKEIREFNQFVNSPFHNKDKNTIKLYQEITKYPFSHRPERFEKERMATRLFKKVDDHNLKKLGYAMSNLTKLAEDYLIWKELKRDKEDLKFLELKTWQNRGIDKMFFKVANKFEEEIEEAPYRDTQYFFSKYRLNKMVAAHVSTAKYGKQISSIEEMNRNLDLFIMGEKLYQFASGQVRSNIFDEKLNTLFQEEISNKIQSSNYPIFKIYSGFLSIEEASEELRIVTEFKKLQDLIFSNFEIFRKEELDEVILILLNHGYKIFQKNDDSIGVLIFELHKFIFEKKLLQFNGKTLSGIFLNTVRTSCNLGFTDWAAFYISENQETVESGEKEDLMRLAKAYLACSKKEYDYTLSILQTIEFFNLHYSLTAKFLIIRCYFEQDEEDLLFMFLNSFENFIRRHQQMSQQRKEQLLNFSKFTRILSKNQFTKQYSATELSNQLKEYSSIFYKSWLKKMIEQQK